MPSFVDVETLARSVMDISNKKKNCMTKKGNLGYVKRLNILTNLNIIWRFRKRKVRT